MLGATAPAGHGGGGGDRGEQPAGLGDGDLRGLALDRPVALAAHRQRRVEQDGVAATRASKKCRRVARCSLREGTNLEFPVPDLSAASHDLSLSCLGNMGE